MWVPWERLAKDQLITQVAGTESKLFAKTATSPHASTPFHCPMACGDPPTSGLGPAAASLTQAIVGHQICLEISQWLGPTTSCPQQSQHSTAGLPAVLLATCDPTADIHGQVKSSSIEAMKVSIKSWWHKAWFIWRTLYGQPWLTLSIS